MIRFAMVWMNGQWMEDDAARVSVFDRSFQLGDGLFETMRHAHGRILLWDDHWSRLVDGCSRLQITLPHGRDAVLAAATDLARRSGEVRGLVRLHVSRGVGRRGYSPVGADRPLMILSNHPAPPATLGTFETGPSWQVVTAGIRLPVGDPLAPWKTSNRLINILARSEADAQKADEAILLNGTGLIAEASAGNIFWWRDGILETPHTATGALGGITRKWVMETARSRGIEVMEVCVARCGLGRVHGMFLTNTAWGVVPVGRWDKETIAPEPLTLEFAEIWHALAAESGCPSLIESRRIS